MNIPYLTIELLSTLFTVYTIIHPEEWWNHYSRDLNQILAIIALIASIAMFPIGFIPGIGGDRYTVKDAYSQRIGNEIVAKVDGWPIQTTDKIEFMDVPLQIKRVEPRNVWDIDYSSNYRFEIQAKKLIKTER